MAKPTEAEMLACDKVQEEAQENLCGQAGSKGTSSRKSEPGGERRVCARSELLGVVRAAPVWLNVTS